MKCTILFSLLIIADTAMATQISNYSTHSELIPLQSCDAVFDQHTVVVGINGVENNLMCLGVE